jgi:hypothetical protein
MQAAVTAIACFCAAMLIVTASAQAAAQLPNESHDGLELVPRRDANGMEVVYVRPGATLTAYKRVMLDPVTVAFDPSWKPRPAMSAPDRERVRRELAEAFRTVFAEELATKGGYAIVETAAPDVLRVSASIVDLYIEMPGVGTSQWSRTVVTDSRMSLIGELRDAESGAILARVADRRVASSRGKIPGSIRWTTQGTNRAEALRALQTWAELLRSALDSARAAAP